MLGPLAILGQANGRIRLGEPTRSECVKSSGAVRVQGIVGAERFVLPTIEFDGY